MGISLDLVRVAGLLNNLDEYSYGFVGVSSTALMEILHAINELAILFVYDPIVKDDLHFAPHGHTVFAQRSLRMLVAKVNVVVVMLALPSYGVGALHKMDLRGKAVVDLTGTLSPEDFDCAFHQVPSA